jgi:hypothetical protein
MGRYGSPVQRETSVRKPEESHVMWRGLGCVLMIVIPLISWALSVQIVNYMVKKGYALPVELMGRPSMPGFIRGTGLNAILLPLFSTNNIYAYLFFTLICIIVISSVFSLVYAIVYRAVNPYRYGPTDAPPPKRNPKKKSR